MQQSPLKLFLHLKTRLEERGSKHFKFNSCLFCNGEVIWLVYVYDCLFYARDNTNIDKVIRDLNSPMNIKIDSFLFHE